MYHFSRMLTSYFFSSLWLLYPKKTIQKLKKLHQAHCTTQRYDIGVGTPCKPSGTTLEPGTPWNSSVTNRLSQTLASGACNKRTRWNISGRVINKNLNRGFNSTRQKIKVHRQKSLDLNSKKKGFNHQWIQIHPKNGWLSHQMMILFGSLW